MKRESEGVFAPPRQSRAPWGPEWTALTVIELLEPMVLAPRRARLLEVISQRVGSVTLLMDAPHDPHNGAAILRSCDAFGVPAAHVVPRHEEFLVAASVAKGTERWVDVVHHASAAQAITCVTQQGFELVATHPRGELLPDDLATIPRLCLVFGNEHDGISEELASAASRSVRIPMRGFVESLNVSVTAAILLGSATAGRSGDLGETERRELYARGLFASVGRAAEVLAARRP